MTVKELKEKLNLFPDDFIVMIPNCDLHMSQNPIWYVPAANVASGCNEADRCIFIDSEDD